MKFQGRLTTEELLLSNGITAFIRTRSGTGLNRIDLSLYKYKSEVENPEVRVYSRRTKGLITMEDFADIYEILADEDKCYKLWNEGKNFKEEQNQ